MLDRGTGVIRFVYGREVGVGPTICLVIHKSLLLQDPYNTADRTMWRMWLLHHTDQIGDGNRFGLLPDEVHDLLFCFGKSLIVSGHNDSL